MTVEKLPQPSSLAVTHDLRSQAASGEAGAGVRGQHLSAPLCRAPAIYAWMAAPAQRATDHDVAVRLDADITEMIESPVVLLRHGQREALVRHMHAWAQACRPGSCRP